MIWGILLTVSPALIAGYVILRFVGFPVHSGASPMIMAPIYLMFGWSGIALIFRFLAIFRIDLFLAIGFTFEEKIGGVGNKQPRRRLVVCSKNRDVSWGSRFRCLPYSSHLDDPSVSLKIVV